MKFMALNTAASLLLALSSLTTGALAQGVETLLVDPGRGGPFGSFPPAITRIDLSAGGVLAGPRLVANWLPEQQLTDLVRVGSELWGADRSGLVRFDRSTFSLIDVALTDVWVRTIVPSLGGGAVVFGREQASPFVTVAVVVDALGNEVTRTQNVPVVRHAIGFGSGYLAVIQQRVEVLDAAFASQGIFSPSAEALYTANGFPPDNIDRIARVGSRVAYVSIYGIVTVDAAGNALGYANESGVFESGAALTDTGALLIADGSGLRVSDLASAASTRIEINAGLPFLTEPAIAANTVSSRFCPASANSTGVPARLAMVASDDIDDRALNVLARGIPAGQFTLMVHGMATANLPFGNGTLCISPVGGNLIRGALGAASAAGTFESVFDFQTPGAGAAFAAGTTWAFQAVYRDPLAAGAPFNTTDALTITFRP